MKILWALSGIALVVQTAVGAAEPKTVEELAVIRETETARLDRTSILSRGEQTRFDVGVAWRDPAQRPEGAAATRVVRYVANCKENTLALAMVVTNDAYGKTLKRYLVPPGSGDYTAPLPGSQEANWIDEACRSN